MNPERYKAPSRRPYARWGLLLLFVLALVLTPGCARQSGADEDPTGNASSSDPATLTPTSPSPTQAGVAQNADATPAPTDTPIPTPSPPPTPDPTPTLTPTRGQVGDGTTAQRTTPVDVSGFTSGVAAVAAGLSYTCALTTAAGLECWGQNDFGQLGDGTTTTRTTPVHVSGLTSDVDTVAAGDRHACALTTAGGVKCWGNNFIGQVGDGTKADRVTPVDVSGLTSGAAAVTAGGFHACALTSAGGVKCWGNNGSGQLGDGSTTARTTPVDVSGLTSGVAAVATGEQHTCALTIAGGVKCWGDNSGGQLGDGTTSTRRTAVDVSGLTSGVAAVAAGGFHTCALTTAAGVKCWGSNRYGQIGDGSTSTRRTAVDVSGLTSGVATVAAGMEHTCILTTAGGVKCWGHNASGKLGDMTTATRTMPVDVSGLISGVAGVSAGWNHTCALTTGAGLKCWGYNAHGQVGDGQPLSWTPQQVVGFEGVPPVQAFGAVEIARARGLLAVKWPWWRVGGGGREGSPGIDGWG